MGFLVLPNTLLTQLQAVNMLISTLGESEVASLTASTESVMALSRLNEADLEVQSEGWNWNREYALKLNLNPDGTVSLPGSTLRVTACYANNMDSDSLGADLVDGTPADVNNVVQRGTTLYDPVNHTGVFTTAPTVDLIDRLDWDSLPQPARQYIAYKAAQRFHARLQGEGIVLQVNSQDVRDSRTLLMQYEDESAHWNSINGNQGVVGALYGIGGMRRYRGGM